MIVDRRVALRVCRSDAAARERVAVSRYRDDAYVFVRRGERLLPGKNWAEGEQQLLADLRLSRRPL
jgi:hypothetical protein